ncbi:hypothetical protein L208DRAFT_1394614, partial [Tricholoma matsutake]
RSKTGKQYIGFCWILNKSDSPFSVEIGMSKTVDKLMKAIKKELERKLFPPIHSSELGVKLRHAQSPQEIAGCVELDPLDELSEHFSSPPRKHVHIIVQLPPPAP